MVQFIERPASFGELLGKGLGGGISHGLGQAQQFAEQMALTRQKQKSAKEALQNATLESGLDIIDQMRGIAARGNIGRGSAFLGLFGGETSKDRGEYSQLGSALIPLAAAGVSIRNQKEFDQYKKVITDPSSTIAEIEGALNGLESIIKSKIAHGESQEKAPKKGGKTKFDSKNPEHRAKRDQVLKDVKGDREKAKKILSREFSE